MTEGIQSKGAEVLSTKQTWLVPIFILALSQTLWMGYQVIEQWQKRSALLDLRTGQEPAIAEAQKLRSALDRLAADTKKLSDQGDPNARLLVVELEKRGVTINSK